MKKILVAVSLFSSFVGLFAAPINKSDWDFDYVMSMGVVYDSGSIRFQDNVRSQIFFRESKQAELYDNGFSVSMELPVGFIDGGGSFSAGYLNNESDDGADITKSAVSWGVSFGFDKCSVDIFDNAGAKISKTVDVNPTAGSFGLFFALIKNDDDTFSASIRSEELGFSYVLDGVTLVKTSKGAFSVGVSPSDFDMSKDNVLMTDFSCPPSSSVPEPAAFAAALGIAVAAIACVRRRFRKVKKL